MQKVSDPLKGLHSSLKTLKETVKDVETEAVFILKRQKVERLEQLVKQRGNVNLFISHYAPKGVKPFRPLLKLVAIRSWGEEQWVYDKTNRKRKYILTPHNEHLTLVQVSTPLANSPDDLRWLREVKNFVYTVEVLLEQFEKLAAEIKEEETEDAV